MYVLLKSNTLVCKKNMSISVKVRPSDSRPFRVFYISFTKLVYNGTMARMVTYGVMYPSARIVGLSIKFSSNLTYHMAVSRLEITNNMISCKDIRNRIIPPSLINSSSGTRPGTAANLQAFTTYLNLMLCNGNRV